MFKFLKKAPPQEKVIIALDIGTDVIKAALFTVDERQNANGEVIGKRAHIKGISEVPQRFSDAQGMVTDITSVIQNAKKAIGQASKEAGLKPTHLVMGIAGEFVKGATSVLKYKRVNPDEKINLSELRNIVHKLQWKAFADIRKNISEETGYPEIDVKLVNASILSVRIDGYKVTNLLGFQGREVEMAIFNSFAPLGHYEAIQNISDELELELLGTVSEPYALSRSMSFEEEDLSAIFIDVGGGATDVAVVTEGAVNGTKMFAIGGRTFTKRLAVELNLSFEEAEKVKQAYTSDKLEQKSKKIISDTIKNDMETWLQGITLGLSEFKDLKTLPSKILLCGGGTYLPEIKDTLNNDKWHKKLQFRNSPQANFIQPKSLTNIVDETKKIKDQRIITTLGLVNIGIELAGEETITQKALRKVIGIMKV